MLSSTEPCVFLVDDDEDIRLSLSRALEMRGYITEAFASAPDFLDAYDPARAGCLILDYGLPEMSGLELQKLLVSRGHAIPVIFITGHGGVPESVEAMKMGAVDFLEKPFRQDTLVRQIDAALAADRKNRAASERTRDALQKIGRLTEREREILEFLVSNPSNTSSKDVARHLDISPRTVDHHRARILEKMQVGSVVELLDLSISTGIFNERIGRNT